MKAEGITPILNVSDIVESFAWFERLGWRKLWDWGEPPTFGAVGSGKVEIFLCQDGQGGRGIGTNKSTFTDDDNDKGCWMSIWVDDVDAVHQNCIEQTSRSQCRPPTCPGTSANSTSATPTATSSASATASNASRRPAST